jgi:hypothetical protein
LHFESVAPIDTVNEELKDTLRPLQEKYRVALLKHIFIRDDGLTPTQLQKVLATWKQARAGQAEAWLACLEGLQDLLKEACGCIDKGGVSEEVGFASALLKSIEENEGADGL